MSQEFVARTIEQVARFFRVNRRTVAEWRSEGLPGERGSYPLPELVAWLKENKWKREARAPEFDDGDPLIAAGDTPALEEYRKWKAKIARLEYLQKRRELVDVDVINDGLNRCAAVLRGGLETLQRDFGPEALAIMDDTILQFEQIVEEVFGDYGGDDDTDEDDA